MSSRALAVVEDSDEDFAALARALSGGPDAVLRFESGEEALSRLRDPATDWPAVLLLDLNLPGRSGLDVIDAIRGEATLQRLPVVVLSGSSRQEDVLGAYDRGANAYIVKPLEFAELRRAVMAVWSFWNMAIQPKPPADRAPGYGLL